MSANRILFAAGGVLIGLIVAKMLNVGSLAARVGLAA